jgi:hypothetical protein
MSAYTPRATPSATLSPSPSPSPSLPHRSLDPSIFVAPPLQEVDPVTVHQRYYQYLRDNPQDASLIRAGYQTAFELPPLPAPAPIEQEPGERSHKRKPSKMAEPRARVARHKGQMNFSSERTSNYPYLSHNPSLNSPQHYPKSQAHFSRLTYQLFSPPPSPSLRRPGPPPLLPARTAPRNNPCPR